MVDWVGEQSSSLLQSTRVGGRIFRVGEFYTKLLGDTMKERLYQVVSIAV